MRVEAVRDDDAGGRVGVQGELAEERRAVGRVEEDRLELRGPRGRVRATGDRARGVVLCGQRVRDVRVAEGGVEALRRVVGLVRLGENLVDSGVEAGRGARGRGRGRQGEERRCQREQAKPHGRLPGVEET